jgi:hypothetical protein
MKAANSLAIRVYWRACLLNMASLVCSRTAQFALQSPEFDTQQRSLDNDQYDKLCTFLQQHSVARWALWLSWQHLAGLVDKTI